MKVYVIYDAYTGEEDRITGYDYQDALERADYEEDDLNGYVTLLGVQQ